MGFLHETESDDLILSIVNLIDVFLVVVAILIIIIVLICSIRSPEKALSLSPLPTPRSLSLPREC